MAKKSTTEGVGIGLAALAAAAAGAYFLYGKNGVKNRKKVKSWMFKMRAEVQDNIEKMQDVSKESYNRVVDETARHYSALKQVDRKELDQMVRELKGHWKSISSQVMKNIKTVKPAKKKTAKK
ncbi:MAG: hypothetical protein COU90_02760 [Candidatus Ryanbacteria bacterium CG10_big_fil_rev_8_21_14_0_10_43_42]|uniref:Uncharacterized protein n=1 Tax=Candidatus Ryanbacteria bacterium CG10_big_fil_rev_8_21_14_0_10_43_42 TaxID=1974864 RepID=A0A2M8KWN8_9BACT|nr:MAG: hypothetical protein COU90_02760 [Candidatus Ryanbacteria bacterium CG10_big_fil_rev_8_21_14_0_10_43_42]